ncbi:acetate--CoA ligase family protein [Bosea sp. BIWAKO-01]|uniref:acetate--CoA ligase family protein n=1 Tax=Bosea sp. BIWAKO-01 TaxID=506668 RepID=UPI0008536CCF|nr:acetate--CoA ligase family protein [Bosea sp. BIWAKO-01]GAU86791.1 acetyl-CoA synthetase (ADP-forming) alpha and beta chains [Bosea sp. BIWAKO-01]
MTLEYIFNPRSVVVVGASAKKDKAGYRFVEAVMKTSFTGKLYLTNPSGGEVFGHRIYKSITEIGEEIDLALIQVAREHIFEVLEQCEAAGVKAVILYTAGFGEADEAGMELERRLEAFIKRTGIRLVGPNCQGIFSAKSRLDLTGSGKIPAGGIGMISQSGGVGSQAWMDASIFAVGFSLFASIGNQTDIEIHEYIDYMGDDADTKAIVLYIEGLRPNSGRAFFEAARRVAQKKPIVAIKGGQTRSGQRAANSHTGSLAGAAETFSSALRASGVIEVNNVEEMLGITQALLLCEPLTSDRLAIVGYGGGHSTLSADAVEKGGFVVPAMSPETDKRLQEALPYWAPRKNPIDLAGGYLTDMRAWIRVMRAALEEDGIGGAMLYGAWAAYAPTIQTGDDNWQTVTAELAALQREYRKPIIAFSHTGRGDLYQNKTLRDGGVPIFENVDTAVKAFRALADRQNWLKRLAHDDGGSPAKSKPSHMSSPDVGNLTEAEAYALLREYGIPVPNHRLASSAQEAAEASETLGLPVVMKISSRKIVHKSDVGGVITNLKTREAAERAYRELIERARASGLDADASEVLVAQQAGGLEVICGYIRDAHFGPTVLVGLGGIFVEVLKDVAIRLAPIRRADALEMVRELKAAPLLTGARGQEPLDVEALADILVKLGQLGSAHPEISEIDLNPVFVSPGSAVAADARIITGTTE